MKPLIHAKISVKKYGGCVEDYIPLHDFFDDSKQCLPDIRHRALLHNSYGIFLLEKVFGTYITNSEGQQVSVRDVGEDHVIQDMGFIPTVEWWFKNMPIDDRMMGMQTVKRKKGKFEKWD